MLYFQISSISSNKTSESKKTSLDLVLGISFVFTKDKYFLIPSFSFLGVLGEFFFSNKILLSVNQYF